MTKSCDARQDLVSGLGSHERPWTFVGEVNIAADGDLKFAGTAVDAPTQLLLGEPREPAFHQIDPRGCPWG